MQAFDGLGMAAQRASVAAYAVGASVTIVAAYEEVETGRREHLRNRPELVRAIAHTRRIGATLVIARLDRLSRSVLVTAALLASGVSFVACDAPYADRTTVLLMALMAEHESRLISARTKEAMQAAKRRGATFGNRGWAFSPQTRLKAAEGARAAHRLRARGAYADVAPIAVTLRTASVTWAEIARHLNALGHRTRANGPWNIHAVQRLVAREEGQHHDERALVLANFHRVSSHRPAPPLLASKPPESPVASGATMMLPTVGTEAQAFIGEAVTYLRVSTLMQGADGLGIEAQRTTVTAYAAAHALRVMAEYVDVESARRNDLTNRPELVKAVARARNGNATLLIARLDRLARSVAVTMRLLESGVKFVACDAPFANRLTIQMLAVMAEEESRMISERTKVAIAAAKAQGRVRRHVCNLKAEHQREGVRLSAEMRRARTREAYAEVEPMALALRQTGLSLKGHREAAECDGQSDAAWDSLDGCCSHASASPSPGRSAYPCAAI